MMKPWLKLTLYGLAALFLMGCALEQLYLEAYLAANQTALETPAGSDETPITFTVQTGQSVAEISGNLRARRLISDTELFRRYVQYRQLDAGIQAGTYTLRQTMTISEIARALQSAQAPEQQVTIPEGRRLEQVAALVSQQTNLSAEEFLLMAQTDWRDTPLMVRYEFLAQIPLTQTLEGFLFPDTYRLTMNATAYDLIERMLANFAQQVTPEMRQSFEQQGVSLYEGLIIASIVEREAVVASERPLMAGVYYNRLHAGWTLSADPTVQYALGYNAETQSWWKQGLTFADLEFDSPYNTYRYAGLPPGPIASPGFEAIHAAAQPTTTDFFFFMVDCTKEDGSHIFALTGEEHMENFRRCQNMPAPP